MDLMGIPGEHRISRFPGAVSEGQEIKAGVDRLYRMQFPRRSALHSPDALPFLYERGSPRLRSDCVLDFQLRLEQEKGSRT
jgi:hypothetical protein